MKTLNQYIKEKLIVNKDYRDAGLSPKSFDELRKIIEDRYDKLGPGTKKNPIDFNDIDVSGIKTLGIYTGSPNAIGLFEKIEFEYIDISDWNVSNVTDMSGMFYGCKKLKSIGDLSKWDVSKVENMERTFYCCYELESVGNLSKWDVSKVESMISMFANCKTITSVGDLSNWDVSNVKYASYMFHNSGIKNTPSWYKG